MPTDTPRTVPTTHVVIIGAGPAGLAAARTLVEAGLRPTIIEESSAPGGQGTRRLSKQSTPAKRAIFGKKADAITEREAAEDKVLAACDFRPETLVWGNFDNSLELLGPNGFETLPYTHLVIAIGATDRILPLPGWTLPGVFSLGGAQVSLKKHSCFIGQNVVFAGASPLLYLAAAQYLRLGLKKITILDSTPFSQKVCALPRMAWHSIGTTIEGLKLLNELYQAGIEIRFGAHPVNIKGEKKVEAIEFRASDGRIETRPSDAIALGYGLRPETQLAELSGAKFEFDPIHRQWFPIIDQNGKAGDSLWLAGDSARIGGIEAADLAGTLAGRNILAHLGMELPHHRSNSKLLRRKKALLAFQHAMTKAFQLPHQTLSGLPKDTIICRCERIRLGDIQTALNSQCGPIEVNRAKSITRCGMGRCQGRFCGPALTELTAQFRNQDIEDCGRLRAQAPFRPIPLSAP